MEKSNEQPQTSSQPNFIPASASSYDKRKRNQEEVQKMKSKIKKTFIFGGIFLFIMSIIIGILCESIIAGCSFFVVIVLIYWIAFRDSSGWIYSFLWYFVVAMAAILFIYRVYKDYQERQQNTYETPTVSVDFLRKNN